MRKRIAIVLFVVCALSLFSACSRNKEVVTDHTPAITTTEPALIPQEEPEAAKDSVFAIYERTPCYGMCPYFNLKIYKDGYAVYEGKNFVDMIGFYHTTFDIASLQNLTQTIQNIGYFSLLDSYDKPVVTDLPTVTTGFWDGNRMKMVADRYKGPDELEEVYQVLDEMIQAATWKALDNQKK